MGHERVTVFRCFSVVLSGDILVMFWWSCFVAGGVIVVDSRFGTDAGTW